MLLLCEYMHCMTTVIEFKAAEIQSCKIQDQRKGFLVSQITAMNADRVPGVMTVPISYVIVSDTDRDNYTVMLIFNVAIFIITWHTAVAKFITKTIAYCVLHIHVNTNNTLLFYTLLHLLYHLNSICN